MTEENKTPETPEVAESTQEEVNVNQTSESGEWEKDHKSMYENMQAALREEREKLKKYKDIDPDHYRELLKEKENAEEKEKLRKGKYEEVISELKGKVEESTKYKDFYESHLTKQEGVFEWLMSQVPEDKKTLVEKVTKNASNIIEKVEILNDLLPSFKQPDFSATPNGSDRANPTNELEQAKKKWDIFGMIANAPSKG